MHFAHWALPRLCWDGRISRILEWWHRYDISGHEVGSSTTTARAAFSNEFSMFGRRYLSSKFDFPSKNDCIIMLVEECEKFIEEKQGNGKIPLIVMGSYRIGKEELWSQIAERIGSKVWMNTERVDVLRSLNQEEWLQNITTRPSHATMHVLQIHSIDSAVSWVHFKIVWTAKFLFSGLDRAPEKS